MSATGHLSVRQGKRVLVLMADGRHFVAKFKEHKDKSVEFYDHKPASTKDIRTLSIYKEEKSNE